MTDETGRLIALAITTSTRERQLTDLFNTGLISLNEYKKRMNEVTKSLREQTLAIGGIL